MTRCAAFVILTGGISRSSTYMPQSSWPAAGKAIADRKWSKRAGSLTAPEDASVESSAARACRSIAPATRAAVASL
jgi:hypothetical protein